MEKCLLSSIIFSQIGLFKFVQAPRLHPWSDILYNYRHSSGECTESNLVSIS